MIVVDKEINKHQKKYQSQFQKVLMMELELDLAGKGEAGTRGGAYR